MSSSAPVGRGLLIVAAVALSAILYGVTVAPGVLWQDSAMFQYRVHQLDLFGHKDLPLAHPLYVLLARAWAFLPLGNFALRVNLFSAVCSAACVGLVVDLLLRLTGSRSAAAIGGLMLAVSHTFWTHAVMAEVYALYALGLVAELWLLERFFTLRRWHWLALAMFVNGLNLSNHLMAILHLPAYAGAIVWAIRRGGLPPVRLPLVAIAWLVGTIPYASLIGARIASGDAVGATLVEALVGPSNRARDVFSTSFSPVGQLTKTLLYFGMNFPTPAILAAVWGLRHMASSRAHRWLVGVGGSIAVLDFVFAFRYPVPDQFVFFTPCYVLVALFAGVGVARWLSGSRRRVIIAAALALMPVVVYEVVSPVLRRLAVSVPGVKRDILYRDSDAYFLRPRKNGETSASRFAREALATAGPDGLLIADTTVMNALVYVRDVEGAGRGVTLHTGSDLLPDQPRIELTEGAVRSFADRGRAFTCTDASGYLPPWIQKTYELIPEGAVFRLARRPEP